MQTATLIISLASLTVSTVTLGVIILGGRMAKKEIDSVRTQGEEKLGVVREAFAAIQSVL